MSVPSGRKWRKLFAQYNPNTLSWRTLQPSLPLENSDEPPVTWPRSGMWDSGAAYELPMWAPPMAGPESSSLLPTPMTSDANGAGVSGDRTPDLRTAISLLPTPDSYEGSRGGSQHPDKRKAAGHSPYLASVAEHLLPTPRAQNGEERNQNIWKRPPDQPQNLENALALLPTLTAQAAKHAADDRGTGTLDDANLWSVAARLGASMNPPSDAGNTSSDAQPQHPQNPPETEDNDSHPTLWSG